MLAIGLFCIKNSLTFLIWSNGSEKTPISLLMKWSCWIRFFWTIWSNKKNKDIFDAKMAYGQQHFLVWFFAPATPSHTSFSDSSLSVTWSFIWKKLSSVTCGWKTVNLKSTLLNVYFLLCTAWPFISFKVRSFDHIFWKRDWVPRTFPSHCVE